MKKILKYTLTEAAIQDIEMPKDAEILCVQVQNGNICIWALCELPQLNKNREFHIVGTGWDFSVTNPKYIGTVQTGAFVWHIYESLKD